MNFTSKHEKMNQKKKNIELKQNNQKINFVGANFHFLKFLQESKLYMVVAYVDTGCGFYVFFFLVSFLIFYIINIITFKEVIKNMVFFMFYGNFMLCFNY